MHSIVLMIFMIIVVTLLIVYYNCNESYSSENNENKPKKYCYNVKNNCEKVEQTKDSCSDQYTSDTLRNCQKLLVSPDLNDIVTGSYENKNMPYASVEVTFDKKTLSGEINLKNVKLHQ